MKNKTLILSTALIACIGVSIYQLNKASATQPYQGERIEIIKNIFNYVIASICNFREFAL